MFVFKEIFDAFDSYLLISMDVEGRVDPGGDSIANFCFYLIVTNHSNFAFLDFFLFHFLSVKLTSFFGIHSDNNK